MKNRSSVSPAFGSEAFRLNVSFRDRCKACSEEQGLVSRGIEKEEAGRGRSRRRVYAEALVDQSTMCTVHRGLFGNNAYDA